MVEALRLTVRIEAAKVAMKNVLVASRRVRVEGFVTALHIVGRRGGV